MNQPENNPLKSFASEMNRAVGGISAVLQHVQEHMEKLPADEQAELNKQMSENATVSKAMKDLSKLQDELKKHNIKF